MMVLRWTKLHDVFNLLRIVHFLLFALTVFIVYWLRGRRRIKRSRVIIAQVDPYVTNGSYSMH